jgi:excinuclease ABC subunit C
MEYEIGRCTAPCVDLITHEAYMEDVEQVILFLRGKNKELERIIERRMKEAAERRAFELAARYRDQLRAIGKVFETQKAQEFHLGDLDVFSTVQEGEHVSVQELLVRDGKIVNSQCHTFRTRLEPDAVLTSFLTQCFLADRYVPPEILVDVEFDERPILEEWLTQKRGSKVRLYSPKRGDKTALVELARKNARNAFLIDRDQDEQLETLLASLQKHLKMDRPPRTIECYDISNFQGSLAVGSMVTFEDGKPAKGRYRKFRIQTVVGADDFRCMAEVLERRLRRDSKNADLPDLIIVDGGKGQLGVAVKMLAKLGISDVAIIGLAKERRRKNTTERVFLPGHSDPLPLAQDTRESLYLQRIRDEAHRFAIRYHRELRRKKTLRTGLEDIPGIGKKRRDDLIERFGTLKKIGAASKDEIAEVVGAKLAETVQKHLAQPPKG